MNSQSRTILVTERNANIRDLLRREFGKEGFDVCVAADSAALRERLTDGTSYALAIVDEDLPSAGEEPALAMILRLSPGLPVILHAFPGGGEAESGPEAVRIVRKSGDFDCLKRAVLEMTETRTAPSDLERGR